MLYLATISEREISGAVKDVVKHTISTILMLEGLCIALIFMGDESGQLGLILIMQQPFVMGVIE